MLTLQDKKVNRGMLSRLFGSKKKESGEQASKRELKHDWSFVGIDMHSHLVPGIDDGAKDVEDSISLIERLIEMGYKGAVTTPHVKFDHYPNTTETINTGIQVLQQALKDRDMNFPIRAAAEYYIDDHFMEKLDTEPLLTVTGDQVLVELSFMMEPVGLNDILFKIQTRGYRPILAHPERYAYFHERPQIYEELRDRGCILQLNINALTGYYGRGVKHMAEQLLKKGLYEYCGSDMHHQKHADVQRSVLRSSHMDQLMKTKFLNPQIQL